jgi:hypothetical protein
MEVHRIRSTMQDPIINHVVLSIRAQADRRTYSIRRSRLVTSPSGHVNRIGTRLVISEEDGLREPVFIVLFPPDCCVVHLLGDVLTPICPPGLGRRTDKWPSSFVLSRIIVEPRLTESIPLVIVNHDTVINSEIFRNAASIVAGESTGSVPEVFVTEAVHSGRIDESGQGITKSAVERCSKRIGGKGPARTGEMDGLELCGRLVFVQSSFETRRTLG